MIFNNRLPDRRKSGSRLAVALEGEINYEKDTLLSLYMFYPYNGSCSIFSAIDSI
jgi:hypothetical protein